MGTARSLRRAELGDPGDPAVLAESDRGYRLCYERYVVARIMVGDGRGAREVLNDTLGRILLDPDADFEEVKVRIAELMVVVSRAVVDSGGPEKEVLRLNVQCVRDVMSAERPEVLYARIGPALERLLKFVELTPLDSQVSIVKRACTIMDTRYAEKLTVSDIAKEVYVSPYYLCRLFRKVLSESVMEHLTRIRIDHAKRLLECTSLRMDEIARRVGLNDSAHFCKVFKRTTGMSPAHYRRQFRGGSYDNGGSAIAAVGSYGRRW